MSLIDWSDPEEMLGLLVEFVADEALASQNDRERLAFLEQLSRELAEVSRPDPSPATQMAALLQEIHDAQPERFARDPVLLHLADCIEEIERIARDRSLR